MNDKIIDFYLQVADELCDGKEWCISGVSEPLRRFAALVVAAEGVPPQVPEQEPLEKAAKDVLQLVDYMLRNGEWYQAQERADALRAALAQPDQRISDDPIYIVSDGGFYPMPR